MIGSVTTDNKERKQDAWERYVQKECPNFADER